MRRDEIVDEIWVCQDCMLVHANGEISPDRPADLPTVWSRIDFGYNVTMGGTHADDCPNGSDGTRDVDCDCETREFSTSACEGCGDYHAGDRYLFTLWRLTIETARRDHAEAIRVARRTADNIADRVKWLEVAALYRRYLADRYTEDRAQAAWMARHASAV